MELQPLQLKKQRNIVLCCHLGLSSHKDHSASKIIILWNQALLQIWEAFLFKVHFFGKELFIQKKQQQR